MAENPFRQLNVFRSTSQKGTIITDCYRLMYKKELWIQVFQQLNANNNNRFKTISTVKVDPSTSSMIDDIIGQLKSDRFRFQSTAQMKKLKLNRENNSYTKFNFEETLVQGVLRIILDSVYDPIFTDESHGFRERKSCHTALSQIESTWNNLTWCVEGKWEDFIYLIDDKLLLKLISKKIDDRRFLLLIHNALTTGSWKNRTNFEVDGAFQQRKLFTSLLANIYFHELDLFMRNLLKKNPQTIKYVRHFNHFLIGIAGPRKYAKQLKGRVELFLIEKLLLDFSNINLRLIHLEKSITFLGYQIRKQKGYFDKGSYSKQKCLSSGIKLEIPQNQIKSLVIKNGYGNMDGFKSHPRNKLLNRTEIKIMNTYNNELREIADYYRLARNFHHLEPLFFLAESSFIKTIAKKRKSTMKKVYISMRKPMQGALCLTKKDEDGKKQYYSFLKMKCVQK